jgi:hypothetical protein
MDFVRANFDIARAVAHLRAEGIVPSQIDRWRPLSFGLPHPFSFDISRYVDLRHATEGECEAISGALETTLWARRRLSVTAEQPADGDSPPPPPPHSGIIELTLPVWYIQQSDVRQISGADLVIYGAGTQTLASALGDEIFAPILRCPQFRPS